MRRTLMTSLTGAAIATAATGLATPAYAVNGPTPDPSNDPCRYAVVTGAIACQGYYGNNLLTGAVGSNTTSDELTYINLLLTGTPLTSDTLPTSNGPTYTGNYPGLNYSKVLGALQDLKGTDGQPFTYNFSPLQLSGLTIFGAHFGNFPDSNAPDVTAFWLVDLGATSGSSITINNGKGVSNAQIFATGTPVRDVPEPTAWALMLVGFGGIGVTMRRRRKNKPALMQVA